MSNQLYLHVTGFAPSLSPESWAFLQPQIHFFDSFPCFVRLLPRKTNQNSKIMVELPNGCVVSLAALAVFVEKR